MHKPGIFVLLLLSLWMACKSDEQVETAESITLEVEQTAAGASPSAESAPSASGAEPSAPATEAEIAANPNLDEMGQKLVKGFWLVSFVLHGPDNVSYKSYERSYFQFRPDMSFTHYGPTGQVINEGAWRHELVGGKHDFVHLDATNQARRNRYRLLMRGDKGVFIGSEAFNNPDVQLRIENLPTAPGSAQL